MKNFIKFNENFPFEILLLRKKHSSGNSYWQKPSYRFNVLTNMEWSLAENVTRSYIDSFAKEVKSDTL